MVQIPGKYQHVSNSADFEDYLRSLGAPEELVAPLVKSSPIVTISETGGVWKLEISNSGKDSSTSFKLGEPYDEQMPHGLVFKSVTRREGDKFIIDSSVPDGKSGTRIYDFTDAGFTVHLSDDKSGKKASRVYKRI